MSFMISKIPSKSLLPSLFRRTLCTAAVESGAKNLERLANELLDLNKYERDDFNVLFRHKMGLNRYGPAPTGPAPEAAPLPVVGPSAAPAAAAAKEKTAFDVKLEKFDAASKLKVIKEIRAFTDLGLKDAKDLVEKTPSVVKKGVTKEEGLKIVEKLKELGAIVVLE